MFGVLGKKNESSCASKDTELLNSGKCVLEAAKQSNLTRESKRIRNCGCWREVPVERYNRW